MTELRYSQQSVSEDDIAAVVAALRSPWLTQGPAIERFEAALCAYTGARYAVAVSSGTAALHLCMAVLVKNLGRSMVFASPLSFVATANAAVLAGHEVDFCDVDRTTGLMQWERTVSRSGRRCQVIIPVHYAGRACDLSMFQGPVVIEDAAHAMGATCACGCGRVGNCAHSTACCFSFHPVKPMTTGEGGAVMTNDQGFADEVRLLRSHGRRDGEMVALGWNYRMTDIQAALGASQLERVAEMRCKRLEIAALYDNLLPGEILLPAEDSGGAWHLYPVRIGGGMRDAIKAALNAQGIMVQVHYPAIHLQPYYRETYGYRAGAFPNAETWAAEELSLPLHAGMNRRDVERVVEGLGQALKGAVS